MLRFDLSYDETFCQLYNKYNTSEKGKKYLQIMGISREKIDIPGMSKLYFSDTEEDKTIDVNANVGRVKNPNNYTAEIYKGLNKLNGIYLIWKEISKTHGEEKATECIEELISGSYYFHDMTGAGITVPYSYSKDETITIKYNDNVETHTFYSLWKYMKKEFPTQEYNDVAKFINIPNDKLLVQDVDGWTNITQVTKKLNDRKMYEIIFSNGASQIVTDNHPMITSRGEISAKDIILGDVVELEKNNINIDIIDHVDVLKFINQDSKLNSFKFPFTVNDTEITHNNGRQKMPKILKFDSDFGYLLGMYLAEGSYTENKYGISITQCQKKNLKIWNKIISALDNIGVNYNCYQNTIHVRNAIFGRIFSEFFKIPSGSENKRLPVQWKQFTDEFLKSIISGFYDGDGTKIGKKVYFDLRITSRSLLLQIQEILRRWNIFGAVKMMPITNSRKQMFKLIIPITNDTNELSIFEESLKFQDINRTKSKFFLAENSIKTNTNSISRFNLKQSKETAYVISHRELPVSECHKYIYDITTETETFYCNGITSHNCFALATNNILISGKPYGQLESTPPKRSDSFIAVTLEVMFEMANSQMGALAIPDFLVNLAYFYNKEKINPNSAKDKSKIKNDFQRFVHSLNQQYRLSSQSMFSNISIFDREVLKTTFEDYAYPDGTRCLDILDYIMDIQKLFVEFIAEKDPISGFPYRFPVCTMNLHLDDNNKVVDEDFFNTICKHNTEGVFNIFITKGSGKIASCCRLSNDINLLREYSRFDSFANAGLSLGSLRVVTANLARIGKESKGDSEVFYKILDSRLEKIRLLLKTQRQIIKTKVKEGYLKFFDLGWMNLNMFFSTFGINGLYEALQFLDYEIREKDGLEKAKEILIYIESKLESFSKEDNIAYNLEQAPSEGCASTLAKMDSVYFNIKEDEEHPELYANQFVPLYIKSDVVERAKIDGEICNSLTGGSICHLNIGTKASPKQIKDLLNLAIDCGLEHFALNPNYLKCSEGHTTLGSNHAEKCSICGEKIVDRVTRVVGYFTPVNNWDKIRREKDYKHRTFNYL